MINKTKNVLIQITLNKSDKESLEIIQAELSKNLGINFNKSQTIAYLIKSYHNNDLELNQKHKIADDELKHKKDIKNYQVMTNLLKDKLEYSYPQLSEFLGINASTLKKYCGGKQAPTGNNKAILDKAFRKYGIM